MHLENVSEISLKQAWNLQRKYCESAKNENWWYVCKRVSGDAIKVLNLQRNFVHSAGSFPFKDILGFQLFNIFA